MNYIIHCRFLVVYSISQLTVRQVRMTGYLQSPTHSGSSRILRLDRASFLLLYTCNFDYFKYCTVVCCQSSSAGLPRSDSIGSDGSRELALLESLAPPADLTTSQSEGHTDQELSVDGSSTRCARSLSQ